MNPIMNLLQPDTGPQNIFRLLSSGVNPEILFSRLVQTNPQFKTFMEQNKGKTPEQVAKENGIDLSRLLSNFRL